MGYVLGQCPQCNNVMSMPDDSAVVRCPTCKNEVSAMEAAALAGSADQMQQPQGQAGQQAQGQSDPYGQAMQHQPFAPEPPFSAAPGSAFLGQWQTNVPLTIIGVLTAGALNGFAASQEDPSAMLGFISLAYLVYSIVHAAKIYPSCFTDRPVVNSNEAMSFLNAFAGGLIFGLIWNHNLTRREKGVAHIVYIVLIAATFVMTLLAVTLGLAAYAIA